MFDEKYAGNVLMIRSSRDALAAALLDLGRTISTPPTPPRFREAYELLADARTRASIRPSSWTRSSTRWKAATLPSPCTAGDYLTMRESNPDLAFVVPEEGSNWFVDAMCVLKDAQHKDETESGSTDCLPRNQPGPTWTISGTPLPARREALEIYPAYYEETYGEPLDMGLYEIMAAPQEVLDRCTLYENLPADILTLYNDLWTQLGV